MTIEDGGRTRHAQRPALVATGVVIGLAMGAGIGFLAQGDTGSPDVTAPQATTTTPADVVAVEAPWVDGGARFRSSVIVPDVFDVGDGAAELAFQIVPLHWTIDEEPTVEEIPVQPAVWELATTGGAVYEAATAHGGEVVRWAVPESLGLDDVTGVFVVEWRVAVPVRDSVVLPLEPGATASFADGATVRIEVVLDQSNSTIVQLESTLPADAWPEGEHLALLDNPGPPWRLGYLFNQASNVQLIWAGEDPPHELELVQGYPTWQPIEERIRVIGERS